MIARRRSLKFRAVVLVSCLYACVGGADAAEERSPSRSAKPVAAELHERDSAGRAPPVPAEVPPEYAGLYSQLSEWLHQFNEATRKRELAPGGAPVHAAHLLAADGNRGPALLDPTALPGIELTLDRFEHLGVQGVALVIGYPMLLAEFRDADRYRQFYRKVARAVRKRRMKLLVELNVLFLNSEFSPFEHDLTGLTFETFRADQLRMAQVIVDELRPDYLTILHEPQTFAVLAGLEVFRSPERSAAYVADVLDGLRRENTLVGAGSGNFDDLAYARSIARTSVDYVSMNFYLIDPASIERAYAVADVARSAGKPLVLTEGWLFKSDGRDGAAQANLEGWESGFRRDVFDFWEPLDVRFIENLVCFARTTGATYVAPYWTNYMLSYLPYDTVSQNASYRELVTEMAPARVSAAVTAGRFTETGIRYGALLRGESDACGR